jgi:hypothetical protein
MVRKTASIRKDHRLLLWALSLLTLGTALLLARPATSQELDAAALEDLVAPVALYPDDVLGIILPASTFPLDVVRAARFLDDREDDPSLEPDPEWDDSVVALLNYPEVLRMMDENIDWTWDLGEAVLTDQSAVLNAAQSFRERAYAAGNLQSDDKQTVTSTEGTITIVPTDPEVIYIPVYEPRRVIVYQPTPIWYYYPYAYPVYYYPYPASYSFSLGFFWGVTSYFSIGWHTHYMHVHHYTDYGHPYYLNTYYTYTPYYPRNHVHITVVNNNHDHVWQPSPRRGSRPDHVTVEGRDSAARVTRTASVGRQSEGAPSSSAGENGTRRMAAANSSGNQSPSDNRSSSDNRSPGNGNSSSRATSSRPDGNATAAPGQSSARPSPQAGERSSTRPSPQASERPSTERPSTPAAERPSPQVSTRSSSQATTRPAPQTSVRPAPQTSTRSAPQTSTRSATPQTATRPTPPSSSRSAPLATTRPAPSAAPAPSASSRAAPQASIARAASPGQSSSGESARSGSSSGSRMTGAARSGADHGSASARR